MNRETITFQSEAEWHALRAGDITSTECAALFGCSPYATEYELHHRKTGQIADTFEVNERMVWGNRLEAAIAYGIAEDFGLVVEPFKVYMRMPDLRMGSSFDFKIVGIVDGFTGDETYRDLFRENGAGIMEVKNVDGLQFKRGWIADGDDMEAPPHIELQVQHQLEVADLEWTLIAPLVGGNTPRPFHRLRNRDYGEAIRAKVSAFWQRYDAGLEPAPDFAKDADAIAKLYVNNDGTKIDMSDDERLYLLCCQYRKAADDKKTAETAQKAAKAEILTIIKSAKEALALGHKITAGTTAPSSYTATRDPSERLYVTVRDVSLTLAPVAGSTYEVEREGFRNVRVNALN